MHVDGNINLGSMGYDVANSEDEIRNKWMHYVNRVEKFLNTLPATVQFFMETVQCPAKSIETFRFLTPQTAEHSL